MPYTGFLYAGVMIDAAGKPQSARIQLPPGRSRNAADHDAAQDRISSSSSSTRSTARSTAPRPNGTGARRSASCSPRPAIRTTPRKGDVITGLDRARGDDVQGVPRRHGAADGDGRHQRRPRAVRDRARRYRAAWRSARLRRRSQRSISTACSIRARHRPSRASAARKAHDATRRLAHASIAWTRRRATTSPTCRTASSRGLEAIDGGAFRARRVDAPGRRRRRRAA